MPSWALPTAALLTMGLATACGATSTPPAESDPPDAVGTAIGTGDAPLALAPTPDGSGQSLDPAAASLQAEAVLEVRRSLAYALLVESDYAASWEHVEALLAAGDDAWWLHLAAAQVCLYWRVDHECAEREGTRALELEPESARAHMLLGQLYEDLGNAPSAIDHYRQSLALRPSESEVAIRLANLLAQDGASEEAVSILRPALEARPQDARLMLQLARILEPINPAEAESLYERAVVYHDQPMLAYGHLIRFYQRQGRTRDAEAIQRLVDESTQRQPMRPIW